MEAGTPESRSSAQKCIPPIIPSGSVLQSVFWSPPPRSSVTARIARSDEMSDWCEMETSCGFSLTSPFVPLSFGATPMTETEPERTFRTSTRTVSFPMAATYIVRPSAEK